MPVTPRSSTVIEALQRHVVPSPTEAAERARLAAEKAAAAAKGRPVSQGHGLLDSDSEESWNKNLNIKFFNYAPRFSLFAALTGYCGIHPSTPEHFAHLNEIVSELFDPESEATMKMRAAGVDVIPAIYQRRDVAGTWPYILHIHLIGFLHAIKQFDPEAVEAVRVAFNTQLNVVYAAERIMGAVIESPNGAVNRTDVFRKNQTMPREMLDRALGYLVESGTLRYESTRMGERGRNGDFYFLVEVDSRVLLN